MKIAAVLCARNEAHIIEEWIAHHLALGIQRIHVFDNFSTDGTFEKVADIAEAIPGVTVQHWPVNLDAQRAAYNVGLQMMTDEEMDWCAFIDTDEFICNATPASSETFADMLGRHVNHCAIGLHWAVFGSSGVKDQPNGLIQETFLRRAVDNFPPNRHIKSIVRPKYTMGAHHVHGFSLDFPYYTANGRIMEWHPQLPYAYSLHDADIGGWRINHYFCQWRGRWEAKVARSEQRSTKEAIQRTEHHWTEHDRNEVFDPSALRWTVTDKEMFVRITGRPAPGIIGPLSITNYFQHNITPPLVSDIGIERAGSISEVDQSQRPD